MRRSTRKPRISKTGCLFWFLILLIVIVILLYRGKGSFKETVSFIKRSFKGEAQEEVTVLKPATSPKISSGGVNHKEESKSPSSETQSQKSVTVGETEKKLQKTGQKANAREGVKKETVQSKKKGTTTALLKMKTISKTLYFIKIALNGSAKPITISRKITYRDSPITQTINMLLKGPTPSEKRSGVVSFIPEGTKLLSAELKRGHLILNFNSRIEENYSGREAIMFEIAQILLTAFEFQSVESISLLIEGKPKPYITGEGIPLKPEYTRSDVTKIIEQT